jgi:hypothetical protein
MPARGKPFLHRAKRRDRNVRIAGCVFSVNCRSSAGPSKQSREIAKPNASSASSKTCRAGRKILSQLFSHSRALRTLSGKDVSPIADCRLPIDLFTSQSRILPDYLHYSSA